MTDSELREAHEIITDYWQMLKTYNSPDDSDAYWNALIDESDRLWKKHDGHPLATYMTNAVISYLTDIKNQRRAT